MKTEFFSNLHKYITERTRRKKDIIKPALIIRIISFIFMAITQFFPFMLMVCCLSQKKSIFVTFCFFSVVFAFCLPFTILVYMIFSSCHIIIEKEYIIVVKNVIKRDKIYLSEIKGFELSFWSQKKGEYPENFKIITEDKIININMGIFLQNDMALLQSIISQKENIDFEETKKLLRKRDIKNLKKLLKKFCITVNIYLVFLDSLFFVNTFVKFNEYMNSLLIKIMLFSFLIFSNYISNQIPKKSKFYKTLKKYRYIHFSILITILIIIVILN